MRFFLILLSCTIIFSCKILRKKRNKELSKTVYFSSNQPKSIYLPLSDEDCSSSNALLDLGEVKIWIDVSGKKVQRVFKRLCAGGG